MLLSLDRLEASSDGALAIIITITVLEMEVLHGSDFGALRPLVAIPSNGSDGATPHTFP